ncbi:MAG: hypothetical protein JWM22_2919 [Frankiales bacterium]|nr:hypothetical protein [Frankiales bacterium]
MFAALSSQVEDDVMIRLDDPDGSDCLMTGPTPAGDGAVSGYGIADAGMAMSLVEIARVLLAPGSVAQILERIVVLSMAAIDGCDAAGLCLHAGPSTELGLVGGDVLTALDAAQHEVGEGPCVDVLAGADSAYVAELMDSSRWPEFAPRATAAGMRSALAYRLANGSVTLGGLQMYAHLPAAFSATDRAQGLLFAAHAGMALANAQAQAEADDRRTNLHAAMLSREVIGQAQGILMERERITAEQAFHLLRKASQGLNRKLRDVAQELVDTGTVPGERDEQR